MDQEIRLQKHSYLYPKTDSQGIHNKAQICRNSIWKAFQIGLPQDIGKNHPNNYKMCMILMPRDLENRAPVYTGALFSRSQGINIIPIL